MAFPFASFGSFLFESDERAVEDSFWRHQPTYARKRALGSSRDTITLMAVGSTERTFETLLEPTRMAQALALIGTSANFCDWERPVPDSRQAFLLNITELGRIGVLCTDGRTRKKIRARWELVSA